jgi:pyruvate-formate lyase
MLKDEKDFNCKDVCITLYEMIKTYLRDEYYEVFELARRFELFRNKRHKLAWTLLKIINKVHYCHTLHNDMSPNNVMLHFSQNCLDKVYIGICGWAMARGYNDLKESLYIHENEEAKSMTIRNKCWVVLKLSYILLPPMGSRDAQFERWPSLTLKSETFAIGKIVKSI